MEILQSLKLEHEELHSELSKALNAGGATGAAAKAVSLTLHPHFKKEEEYALPPLGLLQTLAHGKATPEAGAVIAMTGRLKSELDGMVTEHKNIVAALDTLAQAARDEKKPEFVRFAEKLKLHAQMEEQILYPAAILVGEYLKLKSGR